MDRLAMTRLLFAAAALLLAGRAALAAAPSPRPAAPAPPADFTALSGARPQPCAQAADPASAPLGPPSLRHCAWSGRIELLYWKALPAPAGACIGAPALAWLRLARGAPPWNTAWS